MTVWKAGMLAVCISEFSESARTEPHFPVVGNVYRVSAVRVGATMLGLVLDQVPCSSSYGWWADRFRPAVEDRDRCEDEFITLLKRSKPAPAQPQKAQVGGTREDFSSNPSAAFAVEGTAKNIAGTADKRTAPSHSDGDPRPCHDLSHNTVNNFTNGFNFVPHSQPDSRKGKQDHA